VDGVARRKRIAVTPAMAQIDGMANTLVTEACRLIEATNDRVPTAPELARALDVSTDALRRAFRQVLGVTPRQYADSLRRERLRRELREGEGDVTRALFSVGYGSTSRLYEGAHDHLGMTPASYRSGGAGATITFTVTDSPLGALLIAVTERGLCKVDLADDAIAAEWALTNEFHQAEIRRDDDALAPIVVEVLARIDGRKPARELPLDVRGTAFQRRVWEELQQIPLGETRTYGEIAAAIDAPRASRAVGSACGANPVPVVVPCHRVVPASGGIGNYGLGPRRKQRLLEHEGATPSDG
jgi:AraC family transcriptional regulator, regulatory protein of adaptative response / methylated-DNA-[protein]-cysteine methyltransferase